ncbi:DNA adenine methylase [Galbibacter sp. PAP.153]|uniref:DNA adenine methylase n=1 Tax=Galbibacter sp. PAP.153 TaxID=3104623 RepID=UPI0030082DF5
MNRTPLRYPGGKQKLTPFIIEILESNDINGHYIEPYAGGAGVALELLLNRKVEYIHLNDSDIRLYSFWKSIKNENEKFCSKILSASLTIEEWKKHREVLRHPEKHSLFEIGFSTFYMNRCNRSGVLNAGVIGGLNQDGNYKMDARFSRNDLIQRIELIGLYSDSIFVSNLDAEKYIDNYIPNLEDNSLIYLDPPYFNKAKDLYLNSYKPDDHKRLSHAVQKVTKPWVLSYDNVPEIIQLYSSRNYFTYDLQYSAARNYKGKEVFVFNDSLKLPNSCGLKFIDKELNEMILK